jgi:putative pyruvate formate lyase activating enzyme
MKFSKCIHIAFWAFLFASISGMITYAQQPEEPDYFEYAEKAVRFMMESKKTVIENGLIKSGVIVRHLILPLCQNDSLKVLQWFKDNQRNGAYLSIMAQFTPLVKQEKLKELNRKITPNEYRKVVDYASELGLENVFLQELSSASEEYIPTWDY